MKCQTGQGGGGGRGDGMQYVGSGWDMEHPVSEHTRAGWGGERLREEGGNEVSRSEKRRKGLNKV